MVITQVPARSNVRFPEESTRQTFRPLPQDESVAVAGDSEATAYEIGRPDEEVAPIAMVPAAWLVDIAEILKV